MSYACRINFCQWFWRADLIQNLNHTSKRSTDTKQMLCPEHNRGKANHCHCIPQVIILTCLLHFHATFTYKVGILLMTIYMGYYVSNYVEVFLIQKNIMRNGIISAAQVFIFTKYYAQQNYFRCPYIFYSPTHRKEMIEGIRKINQQKQFCLTHRKKSDKC